MFYIFITCCIALSVVIGSTEISTKVVSFDNCFFNNSVFFGVLVVIEVNGYVCIVGFLIVCDGLAAILTL